MTLAMAAQGDNATGVRIRTYNERGYTFFNITIGRYLARIGGYLERLEGIGITTKQVHEHHKDLAEQVFTQIASESRNAHEMAALLAMVATSMLATFDDVADIIDENQSMFEAGGGSDN